MYAIGAPQGFDLTLSEGLVSGLRTTDEGRLIQTTAAISQGSSGGGLFNDEGQLAAITTFYLSRGQNLNFAVPANRIRALPSEASRKAAEVMLYRYFDRLGSKYAKRGERLKSLENAVAWVRASPRGIWAWNHLGSVLDGIGEKQLAIQAYRRALAIDPNSSAVLYNLGRQYVYAGDPQGAIEILERAAKHPDYERPTLRAAIFGWLAGAYETTGMWKEAVDTRRAAVQIDKKNSLRWYELMQTYLNAGRRDDALDALQQVIRQSPEESTQTLCGFAERLERKNDGDGLQEFRARLKRAGVEFNYPKDCPGSDLKFIGFSGEVNINPPPKLVAPEDVMREIQVLLQTREND